MKTIVHGRVRNKDLKRAHRFSRRETGESLNWRTWGSRNPWKMMQNWTLSTLEWRLKKASLKVVIVKTNDDGKLVRFCLIFERGGRRPLVQFVLLVKYSTVLNWKEVEFYVRVEVFPPVFKMGDQNKMMLQNFGNLALKCEFLINWEWGSGLVGKLIFGAECNSNNFGLFYCLVYLP